MTRPGVADKTDTPSSPPLQAGSDAFARAALAMFFGGFATFAMLYTTQPLMPHFSRDFQITPAYASLSVSCATLALAVMLLPASMLADRFGRKKTMCYALLAAVLFQFMSAFSVNFNMLLLSRILLGASLAGLPAVGMAYLAEEVDSASLGRAIGLYVGGNAIGGMMGRMIAATLADWFSWQFALAALGVISAFLATLFWRSLPPSQHFVRMDITFSGLRNQFNEVIKDKGLRWLFLISFLLMGSFVSLYNYLSYYLMQAPFSLSNIALSAVFLLYMIGSFASAWAGKMSDRWGRRNVLWIMISVTLLGVCLTLTPWLASILIGVALFTFGFFASHSVASGWVGRRPVKARALAAAGYLCSYYLGSSMIGSSSGIAWHSHGWPGLSTALGICLVIAISAALVLRRLPD